MINEISKMALLYQMHLCKSIPTQSMALEKGKKLTVL